MQVLKRVIPFLVLALCLLTLAVIWFSPAEERLDVVVRPTGEQAVRALYVDCDGRRFEFHDVQEQSSTTTEKMIHRTGCSAHGHLMDGTPIRGKSGTSSGGQVASVVIEINDEGKCHWFFLPPS